MKKKNQKSKNGERRIPHKEKMQAFQQMVGDKKCYNLRITKKSKNKDEVCEATEASQRNLRRKTVKNYSEVPKVVDFELEDEVNNNPVIENDNSKRIPIYRKIEIIEEVMNREEIYDFIDDLQVSHQKIKKRKKSVRKSVIKRVKQIAGLEHNRSQKNSKMKSTKNEAKNVQLKEKQSTIVTEQNVKRYTYKNIKIPEHLQNAGDSTIAEASTIKIIDQSMGQSDRVSPNNSDNCQSSIQDSMSNHSLIRQSISPITKEVDKLCIVSPKRLTDAFSKVQNVVQSTPQTRVLKGHEKKSLIQMNLNKKSICFDDPIHLLSVDNDRLTKQQQNVTDLSQNQKENVSPRKFGTIISNLNSVETEINSSVKEVSIQEKQQSSLKAVMPPTSLENNENDQEIQDDIPSISTTLNKEDNNLRIGNTVPAFKQIVSCDAKYSAANSSSQKENENPDLTAGPSNSEKPKAVILRQSNLNNFLNLNEMPRSSRISTALGIFDDVNNSPINGKKPQAIIEESNAENEFGLDNCNYSDRSSPIKKGPVPIIATARDVARSVKGKLFVKARVKSSLTRKPENVVKKILLRNIIRKSVPVLKASANEEILEESINENEKSKNLADNETKNKKSPMEDKNEKKADLVKDKNEENRTIMKDQNENYPSFMDVEFEENISIMEDENETSISLAANENKKNRSLANVEHIPINPKKVFLDSISFSDTFDFLSENGEDISSKEVPDEIPIFVDLEPVHFSQPPRRSYAKAKKAISFNSSKRDIENDFFEADDHDKPKKKRKRVSKLIKEEQKRMQQWIKSTNETFDEIEQFNLAVE